MLERIFNGCSLPRLPGNLGGRGAKIPTQLETDVAAVAAALAEPQRAQALRARWQGARTGELPAEVAAAADRMAAELPKLTGSEDGHLVLGGLLEHGGAPGLLAWCAASAGRGDIRVARLLTLAAPQPGLLERVTAAARDRVLAGPLVDALACVPLLGHGAELQRPENLAVRARVEILLWEAAAGAHEVRDLGRWLWSSRDTLAFHLEPI